MYVQQYIILLVFFINKKRKTWAKALPSVVLTHCYSFVFSDLPRAPAPLCDYGL